MKLSFYGADQCVTGSCHCLEVNGKKILVDCGLQQGRDEIDNAALPFYPGSIDVVLVTHAHIDHSGRIPMLIKNGFQGRIITTRLTADLLDIMLQDSAHIQEQDAEYQNRKNKRAGRPEVQPIYTVADAMQVREYIQPCEYGQKVQVTDDVTAEFIDAGHLLGSASIKLTCHEGGETRTVVFSGDIGNVDQPIIRDPQFYADADYVLMESTYGDRNHTEVWSYTDQLAQIIDETLAKGGNVVIPAFAVGRTQEMLYAIREIKQRGLVTGHDHFPVYVDSPLAVEATGIFLQCDPADFDDETRAILKQGVNPIWFDGLKLSVSSDESKLINTDPQPKVILSASGMCEAGRIRHHLKHNLWRKENIILFVGYQAEGSLGWKLENGAKSVKLFGEDIAVSAEIAMLHGTSGHADKEGLLNWLAGFREKPKMVFVNHGDDGSCKAFCATLKSMGYHADAPYSGTEYDLITGKLTTYTEGVKIDRAAAFKGTQRAKQIYEDMVAAAEALLALVKTRRGNTNKDNAKLTGQIISLIEKWKK